MRSASHSKSSASATSCRTCGYSMPASTTSPTPSSTTTPKPTSTTSPSSHIHIGSQSGLTDWSHSGWWVDSEGHYVVCKTCGIPMMALNSRATGKNAHYDRNKDGKCDGCGYVMGTTTSPSPSSHIHIGSQSGLTDWSYSGWWVDSEGHYVVCKTCGTPMMGLNSRATGKNAHYDRNKDGKCDGCGYVIGSSTITNPGEHVHTIKYGPVSSNGWFSDVNGHYMKCTGCDATLKYSNQNNINSKVVEGTNAHVLNKNTGRCVYCYYSMKGTTTGSEKTYTIRTSSSAKGIVTASASTAKAGETITITATANSGYKFSSWNYSKAANKKSSTTTFEMPKSNVMVSAYFIKDTTSNTEKTYVITTKSDASKGIVTASKSTAKAGETITITATASAGYKFSSWNYSRATDKKSATTTFVMPKNNVTISANFIKDNNTEHEHVSDGVYYKNYLTHYNKCSIAGCKKIMNEAKHQYDLKTKTCVCGKVCPHSKVSKEWYQTTTYHYKVCNDCGAERLKYDHKYSLLNTCKTCKYIKGSIPMTNPTDPKEEVKAYTVSVGVSQPTAYPNSYSATGTGNYKVGTNVKVSTSGKTYFGQVKFDGWYLDGTLVSTSKTYSFTMPAKDVSLTAKWVYEEKSKKEEVKTYTVSVGVSQPTAYPNSYSATGTGNYKVGTNVKVSTSGKTYFGQVKFDGWYLDGTLVSTSKTYSFTMPAKDVSLTAKWVYEEKSKKEEVKAYTVSVGVSQPTTYNNYFSVTGSGNWKVGDTVNLSTSQTGLWSQVEFKGWEISGVSVSNTGSKTVSFTMPENNVSATAVYEMKEETVKYNVNLTTNKTEFFEQNGQYVEGKSVSIKLPGTSYDKVESVNISGVSNYNLSGKMLTFTMPANDVTINVIYQ